MKHAIYHLSFVIGLIFPSALAFTIGVSAIAGAQTILPAGQTTAVTVNITAAATIGTISVRTQGVESLDYTNAGGGTCAKGAAYADGATCTVNVNFAPKFPGARYGGVVLLDSTASKNVIGNSYLLGTGTGSQAIFAPAKQTQIGTGWNAPYGLALDGGGKLYIADPGLPRITVATPNGESYTTGTIGNALSGPRKIVLDGSGNLYILAAGALIKLTLTVSKGYVQSVIGNGKVEGNDVAVDAAGNLFLAMGDGTVLKETLSSGTYTPSTILSGIPVLFGIAVDAADNVYIAALNAIYKETLANGAYTQSTIASINNSELIAVDGNGNVYIADNYPDEGDNYIDKFVPSGGTYITPPGFAHLAGPFSRVDGLAIGPQGNVFATTGTMYYGPPVIKLDFSTPPALTFNPTAAEATSSDSPQTAAIGNLGTEAIQFSALTYPPYFPEDHSGAATDCTPITTLAPFTGGCTLTIDFQPPSVLSAVTSNPIDASATLATSAHNALAPSIAVSGTETWLPSTTSLATSANPSRLNAGVYFTATVAGAIGSPVPTGTVNFLSGGSSIGSAALVNGTATFSISSLPKGVSAITASYSGDLVYTSGTSNIINQIVGLIVPTVTLTPSASPASENNPVILTAAVAGGAGNPTPTGSITFYSGSTILGVVSLTNGQAAYNLGSLTVGTTSTYTAQYSGDSTYIYLTSSPVSETVTAPNFGSVGTTGVTASVTVTIQNAATLGRISVRTQGAENLDFTNAGGGSCIVGTAYTVGETCTVNVKFKPTTPGPRNGAITLLDSSAGQSIIATQYFFGTAVGAELGLQYGSDGISGDVPIYPQAEFDFSNLQPSDGGVAIDGAGNVYVASQFYGLNKFTVAGSSFTYGPISSTGGPGVAVDGSGNVYTACATLICKQTPQPDGTYIQSTILSGFSSVYGVAIDGSGNIYVGDDGAKSVFKETLQLNGSYVQSTLAQGLAGAADVKVDGSGNVFFADHITTVYKETYNGGAYTQSIVNSSFGGYPGVAGVAVEKYGNIIANQPGYFYLEGDGCSIAGETGTYVTAILQPDGSYISMGAQGGGDLMVVALDGIGNYYFVNGGYGEDGNCFDPFGYLYEIKSVDPNPSPLAFGSFLYGSASIPYAEQISNLGNAPLTITAVTYPADFPQVNPASSTDCARGTSVAPGAYCTVSFQFKPAKALNGITSLTLSENVLLNSNSIGNPQQKVAFSGVEIAPTNANPVFSLAAGTYPSAQMLTITEATTGATVYYTTDGTTPTGYSRKYAAPTSIAATEVVKAIAVKGGNYSSGIVSASYLIQQQAAAPAFSLAGGTYSNPPTVTITDTSPGVIIYYTLNGITPTSSSTRYTAPIIVKNSATLQALAVGLPNYTISAIASAAYSLAIATPVVSPAGGAYATTQTIAITSATTAAHLYYTTNDATPSGASTLYAGPITISASKTLKVIGSATGYITSPVVTQTYTIGAVTTAPTFSSIAATYNNPPTISISDTTPNAVIYYTVNGTTPTTSSAKYTTPITVKNSTTLQAIAVAPGYVSSPVTSASINLALATPIMTPAGGTYTGAQTVAITSASTAARIYYTTNGSTPTSSSTPYTGPIPVSTSETVKAIALATGYTPSAVATAVYTIQ